MILRYLFMWVLTLGIFIGLAHYVRNKTFVECNSNNISRNDAIKLSIDQWSKYAAAILNTQPSDPTIQIIEHADFQEYESVNRSVEQKLIDHRSFWYISYGKSYKTETFYFVTEITDCGTIGESTTIIRQQNWQ